MHSNQVVTLIHVERTKQKEQKNMNIYPLRTIVYHQEYLRRIRESLALVKLLLNKYLLNITGLEEETIRLHAHLRRIRESLASLVRK